ncbi:hypothetical protein GGP41_006445 [Bipolaris sorokiniana]|uniref:BTB domain-containing protein n=1 Tax=Cochliobolus sativus TaxID=45130 RepID=A0A8H5ZQV6_COCSA|nr:hypothetical protein GGP41_006445 [Bipolaris sorokiniana]
MPLVCKQSEYFEKAFEEVFEYLYAGEYLDDLSHCFEALCICLMFLLEDLKALAIVKLQQKL